MRLDRTLGSNRLAAQANQARRRWNQTNWVLVAAFAVLTIVLGYIGFDEILPDDRYGTGDVFIRTLQLFVLESSGVTPPVPWELEVARYLAPAVAAYTAVITALTVFVNESRRLALRLWGRDHVIVCGAGRKGSSLARNLRFAGYKVVVIDLDKGAANQGGLGPLGAVILVGDARQPETLEKAQAGNARALIAMCGDNSRNLEVALVASRARRGRGVLAVYAHVDEADLMQALTREGIEKTVASGDARIQFVNFWELAARHLAEADSALEPSAKSPHVVLVGFSEAGDSLVLHLARVWRNAARPDPLPVTLVDDQAEARVGRLRAAHPALGQALELRPLASDEAAERLTPAPTSVYVREEGEAQSLATALGLRRDFASEATRITIVVDDESGGPAVIGADASQNDIACFGVIRTSLAEDIIEGGVHEEIARAMHDQYVRMELERGESRETNPSLLPWDELPEALKESNRRFADAVGEKLEQMGCTIVPNPLMGRTDGQLPLDPAELEELAVAEHDRWCQDLLRDGWQPTNGAKDLDRKLHPTLVPWEELPEAEKKKDRDAVRGLPQMLARAGFELRRPDRRG